MCGSLERTDFQYFLIYDDVVAFNRLIVDIFELGKCGFLKGLILDNFHFGMM